jgi:hypothetical protein
MGNAAQFLQGFFQFLIFRNFDKVYRRRRPTKQKQDADEAVMLHLLTLFLQALSWTIFSKPTGFRVGTFQCAAIISNELPRSKGNSIACNNPV